MTQKRFALLILIMLLITLNVGCGETPTPTPVCAKCGGSATTSISGPESIMKGEGIPLSKCTKVTGGIYRANLCDSCTGPVVTIKPDP